MFPHRLGLNKEQVELSLRLPLMQLLMEELIGKPFAQYLWQLGEAANSNNSHEPEEEAYMYMHSLPEARRAELEEQLSTNIQCLSRILKRGANELHYSSCGAWFIFLFSRYHRFRQLNQGAPGLIARVSTLC